jgi:hypothetical protein
MAIVVDIPSDLYQVASLSVCYFLIDFKSLFIAAKCYAKGKQIIG